MSADRTPAEDLAAWADILADPTQTLFMDATSIVLAPRTDDDADHVHDEIAHLADLLADPTQTLVHCGHSMILGDRVRTDPDDVIPTREDRP